MTKRTGLARGRAICGVLAMLAALPLQAQTESVIYNFTGGADGDEPRAGLTSYKSGLYGTLIHGGSGGVGEVYKLAPPKTGTTWTKRALYSPNEENAGSPAGEVVADQNGNLYGAVSSVGVDGGCCGFIYELSPPAAGQTGWTENVIYAFTGGADGFWPFGGLAMDQYGALYGATHFGGGGSGCPGGCGTLFRLSYNIRFGWAFEVLYTFLGGQYGSFPNGNLLIDNSNGYIFGTTPTGGIYGLGNVYALIPPTGSETQWTMNDLYDFEGNVNNAFDGATPNGGLVGRTGDLFGTTRSGGASANCCGMLFELRQEIEGSPLYTRINHHSFTGGPDGATPYAGLYQDSSNNIWGTTYEGGSVGNFGTIFELYPDRVIVNDWHYLVAYGFKGGPNDGANPQSRVVGNSKGVLFGTTLLGGQSQSGNNGVVWEFQP
jgi:hypothetical protein